MPILNIQCFLMSHTMAARFTDYFTARFQALFLSAWAMWEGVGMDRWGAEVGFYHTLEQKSSRCVFIEVQKGPQ